MSMTGGSEQEYCTTQREESNPEIHQQVQGHISEIRQYGGWPEQSTGTVLLSGRGQNIHLPSYRDDTGNTKKSCLFKKMKKDCEAEGIEIPQNIMAKDPRTQVMTPQEYLKNVEAGTMPPMGNHNVLKEMGEKTSLNDQTCFVMMEFHDFTWPSALKMNGPQKCK